MSSLGHSDVHMQSQYVTSYGIRGVINTEYHLDNEYHIENIQDKFEHCRQ